MAETNYGELAHDPMGRSLWLLNIPQGMYDEYRAWRDRPKPTKAIINDPATVLMFSDGSKTVAKAVGDEYDPLFGIMACALRKVGNNRVSTFLWEPVIEFLADYLADASECRLIADMLTATADALDLDGVMGVMEAYDERVVVEPVATPPTEHPEDAASRQERTRQAIRDLIDRGELW